MRLDGKRVIVTGGAGGIGGAIARRMAQAGARIIIADLNDERSAAVAKALGPDHAAVHVDVADLASASAIVRRSVEIMGGIDVLVHCAGIAMIRSIFKVIPDDWRHVIEVNLIGTYHCCFEVAKVMVAQKRGGSSITTASVAGGRPARGASATARPRAAS